MTLPTDPSHRPESVSVRPATVGRRRFLGAGTAMAPVILTMLSQPALGKTCFTPSRSLSRNTSLSQTGHYGDCTGVSPGNYKAQCDPSNPHGGSYNWPITPDTPFHPTFSGSRFVKPSGNGTRSMTMREVLWLEGNLDSGKVAFHLIGAYLNILSGKVSPLAFDVARCKTMWSEWDTLGYFTPVAGVKWYAAEIVNYLKSNGIVA